MRPSSAYLRAFSLRVKQVPLVVLVLAPFLFPPDLYAGGKKKAEPPFSGKKVVALETVRDIAIELPDHTLHNFGEDYQAVLVTRLTDSKKYIVSDVDHPQASPSIKVPLPPSSPINIDGYIWSGSVTPSVTVKIVVDALNFQTGSKGERMFYGFDERFRTPFNDGRAHPQSEGGSESIENGDSTNIGDNEGRGVLTNEFPLKAESLDPSWFGDTFDQKGAPPFDSHSGLDLGDGFKLDFLAAWLSVKYASYHSELRLKLILTSLLDANLPSQTIHVTGDGFFFDIAGAYKGYSAGISAARSDAMSQALRNALTGSFESIEKAVSRQPLLAKIDAVLPNGSLLLGTGPYANVSAGVQYQLVNDSTTVIEVTEATSNGSVAHLLHGDPKSIFAGAILKEAQASATGAAGNLPSGSPEVAQDVSQALSRVNTVTLPGLNLPSIPMDELAPKVSRWMAFLRSIAEEIFLPYRVWRYLTYDQTYHLIADLPWGFDLTRQPWFQQIGLKDLGAMADKSPLVAILDSGMDYNHPNLHGLLWLNQTPTKDPDGRLDRYGWDFISGDSRPYDDGYHGTQIASLIAAIAPRAKLLPVKVFNPWGITSSSVIYSGFVYAVDHGAQIIVCGWATGVKSEAIRAGVEYARDRGVVVITAAGDQGADLSQWSVYPASLAPQFDNLLVVTGLDASNKKLMDAKSAGNSRKSNFSPLYVSIGAPSQDLWVAEPRMALGKDSSTGLAAALVAGVMARNLASSDFSGTYQDWIQEVLSEADAVDELSAYIQGGRRLHIKK